MCTLPWPEAPRVDNAIYPDEFIEHWADRYVECRYLYRGISLMQFLADPLRYEHDPNRADPLPLLGAQLRVRSQLIRAERTARRRQKQRDGEPLDLAWSAQR